MFTTLGLFAEVPCPEGQGCSLLACMFAHQSLGASETKKLVSRPVNPRPSNVDNLHVAKRPRMGAVASSLSNASTSSEVSITPVVTPRSSTSTPGPPHQSQDAKQNNPILRSASREISPPPSKRLGEKSKMESTVGSTAATSPGPLSRLPPRKAPKESLNPRMLTKPPATHTVRTAILKKLHSSMVAQSQKLAKDKDSSNKSFILTPDELITMALDEEEKLAKDSGDLYSNVIKLRIVKLAKLSTAEWTEEVINHLNDRYYKINPIQPASATSETPNPLHTGLTSKEEVALAASLLTPLDGLEEFGYVTKLPTEAEIEIAKKGVVESKGWEKCDRCGSRFQVFPGRREDGALTTTGQCTHHPSRPFYPPRKKTERHTGSSEAYFPCCGESLGASPGCMKGDTHVFKVSEAKRLASILQFKETPLQTDQGPLQPVCFDCEMGYTTLGLELIRVSAVSWPEGRELLDVLVKPMGEVLDLNSRYSGVFPEHYASATPYRTSSSSTELPSQAKSKDQKPMQVVDSPAVARDLIFRFLQPDTPLIGHAIDNDLNVCRIIHPTVIDTVILYPHPKGGLPNRMSLKTLSRRFLDRDIQTGGTKGHDSKEDSIATGDLVRVKAGDLWKRLKSKGWRLEDDKLIPLLVKSQRMRTRWHSVWALALDIKEKTQINSDVSGRGRSAQILGVATWL
ncbi:RNA exonuclease Rex3 [Penicillium macrosclerotiorum]|uniref:RNA exonuclease Rex3 n=1 Tax=Penicillium macrosclerotiorum TaxID=303699 RepID=UPI002547535E|nr:RNA exonuclease Rex3 [Penicillium macrosclerotiorum]KAJ5674059.1 RNA exonuclease Rex3 [Penicillium macrosclerotiorum]